MYHYIECRIHTKQQKTSQEYEALLLWVRNSIGLALKILGGGSDRVNFGGHHGCRRVDFPQTHLLLDAQYTSWWAKIIGVS